MGRVIVTMDRPDGSDYRSTEALSYDSKVRLNRQDLSDIMLLSRTTWPRTPKGARVLWSDLAHGGPVVAQATWNMSDKDG